MNTLPFSHTQVIYRQLYQLFSKAPVVELKPEDKYVIFSDLHMGNRSRRDDFRKNAKMFMNVLKQHYLPQDYTLILNGDIEELLKFSLLKITHKWASVYKLFRTFEEQKRFYKIIGNHDSGLPLHHDYYFHGKLLNALRLQYKNNDLFIFHGHQASNLIEKYHFIAGFILRFIAKPQGFKNNSTAYNSRRKYKVEKAVYQFAGRRQIVCIIGHTHRPLFESLSKEDLLKYKIEQLIRDYPKTKHPDKIISEIRNVKHALQRLAKDRPKDRHSLYNSVVVTPVLFNSGCVIGKRGITCLELKDGEVRLIYWYNAQKRQKKIHIYEEGPYSITDTNYHWFVLKKDPLDYIFTRIQLLNMV